MAEYGTARQILHTTWSDLTHVVKELRIVVEGNLVVLRCRRALLIAIRMATFDARSTGAL